MIIGIVGYFTVPSVANYIVHAGGGNTLLYKVTSLFGSTTQTAMNTVTRGGGMVADVLGNGAEKVQQSMTGFNISSGYFKDSNNNHHHQHSKLSGND